jgi:hypothetical protein
MEVKISQIIVTIKLTDPECVSLPINSCQSMTEFLGDGVNVLSITTSFATGLTTIKITLPSLVRLPEIVKLLKKIR